MTKEIMEKLGNYAGNIIALLAEAENKDIVHLTSNDNTQSIVYVYGEDHVKELTKCVEKMACIALLEKEKTKDKEQANEMTTNRQFFSIKGETVASITDTEIITDKSIVTLYHTQDCCECVRPVKILGNPQDLVGKVITLVEEDNAEPTWAEPYRGESHTWTAFYIEAGGNRVEIWWLGESNGYYSEFVSTCVENL